MSSRRDFLKLLGLSLGSIYLSGCGDGGEEFVFTGNQPLPNGYSFQTVALSGQALPDGEVLIVTQDVRDLRALPFPGGVLINDRRHVYFHATDTSGVRGIYRVELQADGTASEVTKVIRDGDLLPDGRQVVDHYGGDVNNANDFAVVVRDERRGKGIYLSRDGGPFERVLSSYQSLPSGLRLHGDIKASATIHDNADILFTSNFYDPEGEPSNAQGLFYMPRATAEESFLLLASGQLLPGTSAIVQTIGHGQLHSQGRFIVHGRAQPANFVPPQAGAPKELPPTYVLRGQLDQPLELLVSHPALGNNGSLAGTVALGTAEMAPRLGLDNYSTLLHQTADRSELRIGRDLIWTGQAPQGGSLSPRGYPIISFLPPVFGPRGVFFVELFTTQGMELVAGSGQFYATVLARGDQLEGRTINTIVFGALPRSANIHGEIALVVEFTNGEHAIVVGRPV